jgi:hypothetical protein
MGSSALRTAARAERQVLALAERLRLLAAQRRYRASEPDAPDAPDLEWLRREMDRMCEAYEAAVGDQPGR